MKMLWCWRCREVVPMLNDIEFAEAQAKVYEQIDLEKAGLSSKEHRFDKMRDYYNSLTGANYSSSEKIQHHKLSLYGPPCESCGKPYRTSVARFCAACGNTRDFVVSPEDKSC